MNFGMNMLVFVKLTQKTSFSAFDKLLSNFNASVDLFGFFDNGIICHELKELE